MRWDTPKTRRDKRNPRSEWHVWFAWYPVEADGQYVWLERVARKILYCPLGALEVYSVTYYKANWRAWVKG